MRALATKQRFVASAIVRVELTRVVRVRQADAAPLAALLRDLLLIVVDDTVLTAAARFADAHLRTLDAIHLATALDFGATEMLVYDGRLAEAAEAVGITPLAPR